jgi:hypothetical protein
MTQALYALNDAQHATVLAALRYYQQARAVLQDVPFNVRDIATNSDTVTPLTAVEVGQLCDNLNHHGLTFGEIVNILGADSGPYVEAAHEHRLLSEGTLEVDGKTIVSESEGGAYVMAWLWVDVPGGDEDGEEDDE